LVSYPGAYHLSLEAVRRVRALGFACGANVFVTNANIPHLEQLLTTLDDVGISELSCEVAAYSPLQRVRRGQADRPTLTTLASVTDLIVARTTMHQAWWRTIEEASEAWHYQQATVEQARPRLGWQLVAPPDRYPVVCSRSGALVTGWPGLAGQTLGNLRTDDAATLFAQAFTRPAPFKDAASYYFTRDDEPTIGELAQRAGNPTGEQVYMHPSEVRLRWLDCLWQGHRKH
jgi:MoaA/NifB/PqqE/SkfB family radical SAM enzyme